jgi:hypothetical protein
LLRATCERGDRELFAAALRACAASESPIFADEKIFVEKASAPSSALAKTRIRDANRDSRFAHRGAVPE